MRFKIYLAGPITGLSYDNCTNWRDYAKEILAPEVHGYSPMRCKDYLSHLESIDFSFEDIPLSTGKAILARDYYDVSTCDIILVNLLGATTVSIGTVLEIGYAHAHRKPIVLVMEKEGNVHEHPMITEAAGFRVDSLESGLQLCKAILLP